MRRMTALVGLAFVVAWPMTPVPLSAECIAIEASLEQRLQGTPLVFIGDVLGIENVLQPDSYRVRVRFRVLEAYHGLDAGEQAFSFRPTAEDFKFEVGQRVLVYAGGTRGNYSTQCSRTRVANLQDPEIRELRRLVRK